MKFTVTRASGYGYENPPCEEAKLESIVWIQTFNVRTPEEFDKAWRSRPWYSEGSNHRINENGCIERDNGTVNVWAIELNTLDDLIEFNRKYGDIIIRDCYSNRHYKEIQIYDDYIE